MCRWLNRDLWIILKQLWTPNVTVMWIPSHCGVLGNHAADSLAAKARALPLNYIPHSTTTFFHVYANQCEISANIFPQLLPKNFSLNWDKHDINISLSFSNLSQYGNILRLKWLWGRTSWLHTGGFWERDTPKACSFCSAPINTHNPDLFSLIAECPSFTSILQQLFSWWSTGRSLVSTWFGQAPKHDRRNFVRSLIPSSLVNHLNTHLTSKQIKALIRIRDTQWPKGTTQAHQIYVDSILPIHPMYLPPIPHPVPDILPLPLPDPLDLYPP